MSTGTSTLVHEMFRIIDGRDFDRLREFCHEDIVYERPGYEPIVGMDELLHFYREVRIIASGEHQLAAVVLDDEHGACWGRFEGLHRNGSGLSVEFADTYVIEEGKIRRRKSFFFQPAV